MSGMKVYAPGELDRLKDAWLSDPDKNTDTALYDQTWSDMNMDSVLSRIDTCASLAGEERLYAMLREPFSDADEIRRRDCLIRCFDSDDRLCDEYRKRLSEIGDNIKQPAGVTIAGLETVKTRGNALHIICALLGVASIAMIFISPGAGLMMFLAVLVLNIATYFRRKDEIGEQLNCFIYLIRSYRAAVSMLGVKDDEDRDYRKSLRKSAKILKTVVRGSFLVTGGRGLTGSILNMVLDYLRIFFHLDLMRFNSMQRQVFSHRAEIAGLFRTLGDIDAFMAIASYRRSLPVWCVPEYRESVPADITMEIKGLYHPLIEDAVRNDIHTSQGKGILITGSNASGKSTFLRATALSAILGQSIATVAAVSYRAPRYQIVSSMTVSDDILQGDSYYMAEIKSVKRILDRSRTEPGIPLLCFVDEVLRGTNTVERIAASSEILKSLGRKNVLSFAATHDIELTEILSDSYDNFHFEETINGSDIRFSYRLEAGPAKTRNAIKLLEIMGYDSDMIRAAEERARSFEKARK